MKYPCIARIQGRIARVTTLFRIYLAIYASPGFAPVAGAPPRVRLSAGAFTGKSLGDVTVAPVVPTVISTHRSRNELPCGIPTPRTERRLSEGLPAATLSAQTHFTICDFRLALQKAWLLYIAANRIANSTFAYYNKINL